MIRDIILIALISLKTNKLRSALTMLGIIIGIMVIVLMQAAIEGFREEIKAQINTMGTSSFVLTRRPVFQTGHDWEKYIGRKRITGKLIPIITRDCESVGGVIPILNDWNEEVRFKNKKTENNVRITGAGRGWIDLSGFEISEGRYFSDNDYEYNQNFVIIGHTVKKTLFDVFDATDEYIFIKNERFKVIGEFNEKGTKFNEDQDNFVCITDYHFEKLYGKADNIELLISAKTQGLLPKAMDEVIMSLRRERNLKADDENDFEIITKDEITKKMNSIIAIIYLVALSIGGMSLLVGSIGIMNMMLVSITERINEIGIRRSLGASKKNINFQFLTESVILSFTGGGIGIFLGVSISKLISHYTKYSTTAPFWTIATAFLVSIVIGLLAGVYPAHKAGNLNPIDALRQE
ncbi:MAG: ABC transporter permease [Candidatus Delongbacteria bacterium]|nr:ABC transporter permease [Candidatus Delongbacteria bacterium]MCG2759966.1 ABC transporter permease [Candidatus Delongbacteria bacterium]